MSSGGLDLPGSLGVEVLPDGVVMYGCSHSYKKMPDGMGEWDDAITFEEDNTKTVAGSTDQQLTQPGLLRLAGSMRD